MDYTKDKCPVCGELFKEDDDIVVCPVCGAPHHRECYNKENHCHFEDKHEEGFDFSSLHKENLNTIETAYDSETIKKMPNGDRVAEYCKKDPELDFLTKQIMKLSFPDTEDDVILGDAPAVYYREAAGKKAGYYLPRFFFIENDKERHLYFNFSAFFIPLTWCVYRKLYKAAALVLALYALLFSITLMPLFSNNFEVLNAYNTVVEEEGVEGLENILNYSTGMSDSITKCESELFEAIERNSLPTAVNVVFSLVKFALRIVFGIYGNRLYFMKVKKLARKAAEQFDIKNKSEKKAALSYMRKKCGTSNMVIVAFAILIELYFMF